MDLICARQLLQRLDTIRKETGVLAAGQTTQKMTIRQQLSDMKKTIAQRDEIVASNTGVRNEESIRITSELNAQLATIRQDVVKEREHDKRGKSELLPSRDVIYDIYDQTLCDFDRQINGRKWTREPATSHEPLAIPDIDDERFQKLLQRDVYIDSLLDRLQIGIEHLKNQALEMNGELKRQEVQLITMEPNVNKTNNHVIAHTNRLRVIIKNTSGRFWTLFILITILLGVVGLIISIATR